MDLPYRTFFSWYRKNLSLQHRLSFLIPIATGTRIATKAGLRPRCHLQGEKAGDDAKGVFQWLCSMHNIDNDSL
jgi:hypothetical protein